MEELSVAEMDAVSGGLVKVIYHGIVSSAAWEAFKYGVGYAMENSHMGRGNFPSVPRPGRE